jgi:hypothetical protein
VESTCYHVRSPCLSPFSLYFSYSLVVWYDCPLGRRSHTTIIVSSDPHTTCPFIYYDKCVIYIYIVCQCLLQPKYYFLSMYADASPHAHRIHRPLTIIYGGNSYLQPKVLFEFWSSTSALMAAPYLPAHLSLSLSLSLSGNNLTSEHRTSPATSSPCPHLTASLRSLSRPTASPAHGHGECDSSGSGGSCIDGGGSGGSSNGGVRSTLGRSSPPLSPRSSCCWICFPGFRRALPLSSLTLAGIEGAGRGRKAPQAVGMASRWFRGASSGGWARSRQGSSGHGGGDGGKEGKKVAPRVSLGFARAPWPQLWPWRGAPAKP